MGGDRIIRHICGNIASREAEWCSTSAWGVDVRGRRIFKDFLGQFDGILQTDGYAAYESVGGPKLVHAGCWSHYLETGIIQRAATETAFQACLAMEHSR